MLINVVELEFKNRKLKTKLAFKTGLLEGDFRMTKGQLATELKWQRHYKRMAIGFILVCIVVIAHLCTLNHQLNGELETLKNPTETNQGV